MLSASSTLEAAEYQVGLLVELALSRRCVHVQRVYQLFDEHTLVKQSVFVRLRRVATRLEAKLLFHGGVQPHTIETHIMHEKVYRTSEEGVVRMIFPRFRDDRIRVPRPFESNKLTSDADL